MYLKILKALSVTNKIKKLYPKRYKVPQKTISKVPFIQTKNKNNFFHTTCMNDKKKKTIVQIQLEAWKLDWNSILTFTGKNELTSKKKLFGLLRRKVLKTCITNMYCT